MASRPYPDPNSRFQILPTPILSPAQCMVCGTPNREVVDFGKELEVNGYAFRVYICILCLRDANTQVEGYLESIGQDTGGAVSAANFERYLTDNNLKVIHSDHFDNVTYWATGLSAVVDLCLDDPRNGIPTEDAEGVPGDNPEDESDEQPDDNEPDGESLSGDNGVPAFTL